MPLPARQKLIQVITTSAGAASGARPRPIDGDRALDALNQLGDPAAEAQRAASPSAAPPEAP
jgi:hypothetical protein